MKIADAKLIPIQKLVEALGGIYSHTDRKGDVWYHSPFRPEEDTASFKINEKLNTWHDFGLANTVGHQKQGSGGDILDLWSDYHQKDRRQSLSEALNAVSGLDGHLVSRIHHKRSEPLKVSLQPKYKILHIADRIKFFGLKDELQRRRISLKLADLYLKEGQIIDTDTGKKYTCFLFENDKGGYEVSIPNPTQGKCFKTCIGAKASSRFLVSNDKNSADVFEGFWDFLSWLEFKGILRPINHTYVLNSTSLVGEACEKIAAFNETVRYVFLFMDNDEAGYQATHAIAALLEKEAMQVASFEQFYKGYKDLNEFWMNKPKLL